MAVYFETSEPSALLSEFNKRIKQTEQTGKITTWEISDDGKFYTHKSKDSRGQAWFAATVDNGRLRFNIYPSADDNVSMTAYGYYHGHLLETFLNHFDQMFTLGSVTPLPALPDKVQSA
jgi:hypothetical protein